MSDLIYKEESYKIIGVLFDVYNNLGAGFLEIVYKDAIEYEFKKLNIPYKREKEYKVKYKDIILSHTFYADFVVFNKIILELKSTDGFNNRDFAQCLNYLKVSDCKLSILANFHRDSLEYKRIIL